MSYSCSIWPNSGISDRLVVVKFSLVAYYWPFLEAEMAAVMEAEVAASEAVLDPEMAEMAAGDADLEP